MPASEEEAGTTTMPTPEPPPRLRHLADAGVIAVLRAPTPQAAIGAAEALLDGGVTAIEITYSTPDAPQAIAELHRRRPGTLAGAGTIRTPREADEAAAAGADFLVSPGSTPRVIEAMLGTGLPALAGALTPTEVMAAVDRGIDGIKVFPGSLGGPGLLRALREPFPDVPFVPTGGVSRGNVADWRRAGALAVGAGGQLCPAAAIAEGRWQEITDSAKAFRAAWEDVPA